MPILKNILITLLFAVGLFLFPTGSDAVEISSDCNKCHVNEFSNPSFFMLPIIADGSADGSTVPKKNCAVCHWEDIGSQHWPRFKTVKVTVGGEVYGGFKSLESVYKPAGFVHDVHNGPKRSVGSSCIRCHGTTSCMACHKTVAHEKHYAQTNTNPKTGTSITTPVLYVVNGISKYYESTTCAAAECHGTLPKPVILTKNNKELCSNCHVTESTGHKHPTTYVENPALDCSRCHVNELIAEHERQVDQNNNPLDCFTCHESTVQNVVDAIAAKNKYCSACHDQYDHVSSHGSTVDINCQSCHKNNLVTEHMENSVTQQTLLSCETCHENTDYNIKAAISLNKSQCTACHTEGHNMLFAEAIPGDIPQYPGFIWSVPQDAMIWAAEPWFDDSYSNGGRRIISDRRTDVSEEQLFNYYKTEMTTLGWSVVAENSTGQGFAEISFSKDTHIAKVAIYKGECYSAIPEVSTGYRIDLLYK